MMFLGDTLNDKGQRRHKWVRLTNDDLNDGSPLAEGHPVLSYNRKTFASSSIQPGAIITIDRSLAPEDTEGDTCTVFSETARIVDVWRNQDQVAEWQASHDAVCTALDAEKAAAKKNKERADLDCLEPVRKAYHTLNPQQQKALLVNVLTYLQSAPD